MGLEERGSDMTQSYWERILNRQMGRRRAIVGGGTTAAAAALLAACGGDESSSNDQPAESASKVYKPVDTASKGVPGGSILHYSTTDIEHFDAVAANTASTVNICSVFAYNRLLKFKSGFHPDVPDGSSEGEMATAFEVSGDGLTLTMKLRKGPTTKWDERAPTNGREMDVDDVIFSYKKFAQVNPSGANVDYNRNPAAPVESVSAPDKETLVFKLAKPDATIIGLFSATDHLYIGPKEMDGGFDPRREVRGNGPWLLEEYAPSVRFVWKKNPNYYMRNRPFPDRIERPIISEAPQRLAQFRAGNVLTDVVAGAQEQVLQMKKDVPQTNVYQPRTLNPSLSPSVWYGYEGDSPFKDVRVRQAFSMMVDRDSFHLALHNADAFEKEGLEAPGFVNTVISSGWGPYWLDPTKSSFGEDAKYLKFNLAEAAKLLAAAGFQNGFESTLHFNSQGNYGPYYVKGVEVLAGFFDAGRIKVTQHPLQYSEFLNQYYFGYRSGASTGGAGGAAKGYGGFSVQAERPYATAVNLMLGSWHPGGSSFHGLTADGKSPEKGDPKLTGMIEDIQKTFDQKAQISKTHELIRYMTRQAYFIPRPVTNKPFEVWWPAISGLGWRERWPNNAIWTETAIDWWVDKTKPPFKT
jgi:ABC-type transport system substrate-binding protein